MEIGIPKNEQIAQITMKHKNKSLLILANAFVSTKSIGGGDRFIMEVAPYLARKILTSIITPYIGIYHWKNQPLAKVKFISYQKNIFDNSDNYFAITFAYLIRTIHAISLLQKRKFDYLITSSQYFPDIIPAVIYKSKNPHTRWTARIYHLIPPPHKRVGNFLVNSIIYLTQYLLLALLKNADIISTDNQETKRQLLKRNFNPNKIFTLPNGVNYQKIKNHKPLKKYKFDAAYIGRLDKHRGIFDLPIIWEKVNKKIPHAKLAIVGYGPKFSIKLLKNKFNNYNLNKNVSFLGYLPHYHGHHRPLYDLLKSIKLLILPIQEGGCPLIIAESMSAGAPVISYKSQIFNSSYSKGYKTVPIKNFNQFSKTIIKLLSNKRTYLQLQKQALNEAKKFNWEQIANNFIKILTENSSTNTDY